MLDLVNQRILQQQKKVTISEARPDDHWIKRLMLMQL